jgi:hypothetical protein
LAEALVDAVAEREVPVPGAIEVEVVRRIESIGVTIGGEQ